MAVAVATNYKIVGKRKKNNEMTISSVLAEVKPVKNLAESLAKKNTLYDDPTYIELMKSKGFKTA